MSLKIARAIQQLPWLQKNLSSKKMGSGQGFLYFVGREEKFPASIKMPKWVKDKIRLGVPIVTWATDKGPHWCLSARIVESEDHYGVFAPSAYSMARDLVGSCFRQSLGESLKQLNIQHFGKSEEEFKGLVAGLELGQYSFQQAWKGEQLNLKINLKSSLKNSKALMGSACQLAESMNLSRFLVDLPPNELNPKTYSDALKSIFSKKKKTKVTVWDATRLKKEKMGLHIGVGQGSVEGPSLVLIEYRGAGPKEAPIAFVGKGITFDTGGTDLKPASGMRNMKKDMGGSASVIGIASWVVKTQPSINCDFYVALAENSVSKEAMRPGDILTARNGKTVEIHNTDAEGRLVLADALTVASEKKPKMIIDIATLTGAIKVGLGSNVPGLFSNDDNLSETLLKAGQSMGDVFWRMPLIPEERGRLRSDVADMVNCTDGFGGAITAGLFLQTFVGKVPWVHVDIYSWVDGAKGVYRHKGGNGQVVQAMSHFLSEL